MTLQSFQSMFSDLYPEGNAHDYSKRLFQVFDVDGSNDIDFTEFIQAFAVFQKGTFEDRLDFAFTVFDMNQDGRVSRKEVHTILGFLFGMRGRLFQNIDFSP